MVLIKKPVQKLLLKPKRKTGGSGSSNRAIQRERARIEAINREIASRGPTEAFPGSSGTGTFAPVEITKSLQGPSVSAISTSIGARTIAAQLEGGPGPQPAPGTARFDELEPSRFGFTSGIDIPFRDAASQFIQRIPGFVGGLGGVLQQGRSVKDIDPFEAFSRTGKRKGEAGGSIFASSVFIPQFGTVTAEEPTGVKTLTGFDILKEQRRQAGVPEEFIESSLQVIGGVLGEKAAGRVSTTFQERVTLGELTVEQATAQGQQALDIELGKIGEDLSGLGAKQLLETSGKRVSRGVKTGIALAPILLAPLTPSISLRAAAGIGSQAFSIKAGQESLEAFQRGDFLVGGLKTAEAGAFAFGGGQLIRGALGPTRSLISGQIEGIKLSELESQSFSLGGAELLTGPRGVVTELSLSRVVPGATQEVGAIIPTFRQGEQAFSIVGGRLVSTTRIQPFAGGEPIIKFKDVSSFIGKGDIGVGGRLVGPASSVDIGEGISTSVGKITVPRGEQAITTGFGGLAQRGDDIINIISGRPFARRGGTFKIAPTTAGPIKISQKDIIDIGGISPAVANGRAGRIIPGQGQVTQFIGTGTGVRATRDIVGGSIQAGIRAAEVGGGVAIQQAGISQFVPSLTRGGISGLGFKLPGVSRARPQFELEFPSPTIGLGGQTFAPPSQTFKQQTTFTTPPQLKSLLDLKTLGGALGGGATIQRQALGQLPGLKLDITPIVKTIPRTGQEFIQPTKQRTGLETALTEDFIPLAPGRPRAIRPGITPSGFGFGGLIFPLPVFGSFGFGQAQPKGRRPKVRIAPSFTGETLFDLGQITGGPLPTGITPRLRLVPKGKKAKKSKKKKK